VNAQMRMEAGLTYIQVTYDAAVETWSQAVDEAVAAYGLQPDQTVVVVAQPTRIGVQRIRGSYLDGLFIPSRMRICVNCNRGTMSVHQT
jgi:hypothetical protein